MKVRDREILDAFRIVGIESLRGNATLHIEVGTATEQRRVRAETLEQKGVKPGWYMMQSKTGSIWYVPPRSFERYFEVVPQAEAVDAA